MNRNKIAVIAVCVLAVILGVVVFFAPWGGKDDGGRVVSTEKEQSVKKPQTGGNRKVKRVKKPKKDEVRHVALRVKPSMLSLDDDEEALLNEFSRQVLRELQEALDTEDREVVSALVMKMLERPPDPMFGKEGVARILRRKAVEALGWFGAAGLPELVGMLADADAEIAQATFDQFSLALEDISLSDYDRADIITMATKVLTNVENLEQLLPEIYNMRHSVGVATLLQICLHGTPEAQSLMKEAIEFFTGEENIGTVEALEQWLEENPDGPDDDDLYGGDSK